MDSFFLFPKQISDGKDRFVSFKISSEKGFLFCSNKVLSLPFPFLTRGGFSRGLQYL